MRSGGSRRGPEGRFPGLTSGDLLRSVVGGYADALGAVAKGPDLVSFEPLCARRCSGVDLDLLREAKEAALVEVAAHHARERVLVGCKERADLGVDQRRGDVARAGVADRELEARL